MQYFKIVNHYNFRFLSKPAQLKWQHLLGLQINWQVCGSNPRKGDNPFSKISIIQFELSHKMSYLKSHIIHGELSQKQRTSGWWPTKHDGHLIQDVRQVKYEIQHRTGDRSLGAPTCHRQEGLSTFRGHIGNLQF